MTHPRNGADLFTIEASHGKPRLTRPRPSDLGSVPTGQDRRADRGPGGRFAPGNRAAADRGAKRALTAPMRSARARVRLATEGSPPSDQDRLMADAMPVFASVRRELGTRSTLVLASIAVHASESVLAGHFLERAAAAGFETAAGARLLGLAHSCETQASRAMTAALAAAKALATKRKPRGSVVQAIEAAAAAQLKASRKDPTP